MTAATRLIPLGFLRARSDGFAAPMAAVNPVVRAALFLFVLSIPFELPNRTIPFELPTATAALFLLTTMLNPSVCFRRVPGALLFLAAFTWVLIASAIVNNIEQTVLATKAIVNLVLLLLVSWTSFNLLADARVMRAVLLALVLGPVARAGIQLLGIGTTSYALWGGGERVTVLGQNANLSAMILAAGIASIVGLQMLRDARWPRFGLLTWPLAGAMGFAIIQGGSRGGLMCALAGVIIYLFRGRTIGARVRNFVIGLAAVAALGYGAMRTEGMHNRIEEARHGNIAGREKLYPAALEMIRERPVLGWGPWDNQFELARRINERVRPSRDMHNIVLEVFTASGVLGALLFLAGVGLCFRHAFRAIKGPLGALPLAVLAAVLVGTISGTWLVSKILWLALTLAVAAGTHWNASAAPAATEPA